MMTAPLLARLVEGRGRPLLLPPELQASLLLAASPRAWQPMLLQSQQAQARPCLMPQLQMMMTSQLQGQLSQLLVLLHVLEEHLHSAQQSHRRCLLHQQPHRHQAS